MVLRNFHNLNATTQHQGCESRRLSSENWTINMPGNVTQLRNLGKSDDVRFAGEAHMT